MLPIQQDLESYSEYVRRKFSLGMIAGTIDDLYDECREVLAR